MKENVKAYYAQRHLGSLQEWAVGIHFPVHPVQYVCVQGHVTVPRVVMFAHVFLCTGECVAGLS